MPGPMLERVNELERAARRQRRLEVALMVMSGLIIAGIVTLCVLEYITHVHSLVR